MKTLVVPSHFEGNHTSQTINRISNKLEELLESETWITGSIIETKRIQSGKEKPFCYLSRSLGEKEFGAIITSRIKYSSPIIFTLLYKRNPSLNLIGSLLII